MARTAKVPTGPSLEGAALEADLQRVARLGAEDLRSLWRSTFQKSAPGALSRDLLARAITFRMQEHRLGGLDPSIEDLLARLARGQSAPARRLKPGSVIVRQYGGTLHEAIAIPGGFLWQGTVHTSLSAIARAITGTAWNGPRFFGLRDKEVTEKSNEGHRSMRGVPPGAKVKGASKLAEVTTGSVRKAQKSDPPIPNRRGTRP